MNMAGEDLYHLGIALLIAAGVVALVAVIVLSVSKKRLQAALDQEYGPEKRGKRG